MKNNKTANIIFRLEEKKKQEILRFAYDNRLSVTDVMLLAFDNYKKLIKEEK